MGSSSLRHFLVIAGSVFLGGWVATVLTLVFTYRVMPAVVVKGSPEWWVSAVVGSAYAVPYLVGGLIVGVVSGCAEPGIKPVSFFLGLVGWVLIWLYAPTLVTLATLGKHGRWWEAAPQCVIVIAVAFLAFVLARRSRPRPVA